MAGNFLGISGSLRKASYNRKLVLEAEMRHTLKIPNPQLDKDQLKVLDMAREKKDLVLCGGFGTGKTVLGCEAAKIEIAKLMTGEGLEKQAAGLFLVFGK